MKKPFPLFDLKGFSFTVTNKVMIGCNEFFPGYKYTFNAIQLRAYKFSKSQIKKHGIDASHSFTAANIYNGHTGINVNLRACIEEITPFIDKFNHENESLLSTNKINTKDKTMKPQKFNQADTNLFNAKKNISNLVYLKFDISKIEIDIDSSIRHEYDPEKLQELAESIRANNNELIQPIVISNIRNSGDYRVVAGRRRFLACRDILKLKTISAIVKNFETETDEFKAQFAENEERENWTDFDYVKAINKIKDRNKEISNQDIAKIFNKTIDWVKKKMQHLGAIKDLPESALSHLSQIPTSHAIELKKLPKEEKEKAIKELGEAAKNNLPLPTVKKIRENVAKSIPITSNASKKKISVNVDKKEGSSPKAKKYRPDINTRPVAYFIDQHDVRLAYKDWKNTGSIEPEHQALIVKDIRNAVSEIKLDLEHAKKIVSSYETELKNLISDSIALQEQQMFPVKKQKAEELDHFEIMRNRQDAINKAMYETRFKKKAGKK